MQRPGDRSPERVCLVRALPGLGDFLCVVPALRALRAAFPHATITLLGLPGSQPLVGRFSHYIDELVEFPGFPGIPEYEFDPRRLPAFLSSAHERGFDLAIQMHGSGLTSNAFTLLLGANMTAGFYPRGHYCPDGRLFLPYEEGESEVKRYLRLLEHLGIPSMGEELEFPLRDEDWEALNEIEEVYSLRPGEYVCIHPGANDGIRRWGAEGFAAAAGDMASRGLQVVITGTAAEADLAQSVCRLVKGPYINLCGRTGVGTLAALLSGARMLVCNDTGVSHLAAALQVPSVVVFTATDPARWAPLDRDRHRIVVSPDETASDGDGGSDGRAAGMEEVIAHARGLLGEGAEYAD